MQIKRRIVVWASAAAVLCNGCFLGVESDPLPEPPTATRVAATEDPSATPRPTKTRAMPTLAPTLLTREPPDSTVPEGVRYALEQALTYLEENDPEAGVPVLGWSVTSDTPEGLVGAAHYALSAEGWTGRLIAPVVAPSVTVYNITLQSDSGYHWVGRVDGQGNVEEMPTAAAGARQRTVHIDEEAGYSVSYDRSMQVESVVDLEDRHDCLTLARDGWRLIVCVSDDLERIPMVMGGMTGEWVTKEPLVALDPSYDKQILVVADKVKACKYFRSRGRIVYVHLLDASTKPYEQVEVLRGLEHEVDTIVASLALIDR